MKEKYHKKYCPRHLKKIRKLLQISRTFYSTKLSFKTPKRDLFNSVFHVQQADSLHSIKGQFAIRFFARVGGADFALFAILFWHYMEGAFLLRCLDVLEKEIAVAILVLFFAKICDLMPELRPA